MKLLNLKNKKKITAQEQNNLKQKIQQEINNRQIKFKYYNYLPWKILVIAISTLAIIGSIVYFIVKAVQTGEFTLTETEEILFGVIGFGLIGLVPLAYREWQKRNRKEIKSHFSHFEKIRIAAFTNWFNQTYDDAQIAKRLTTSEVKTYVAQLRKTNNWLKVPKIDEIHPGYQIITKNNVIIDCFVVTILEYQKEKIKHHNYFSAVIKNQQSKWDNFTFEIIKGRKNAKTLENANFNQKWGYQANDKVKLRMLLTPWTQEALAKSSLDFSLMQSSELTYWWGECKFNNNLFEFNLQTAASPEKTIDIIVDDIIEDFQNLEFLLKELAVYKSLIF